jgi:molybdopterin-biosynthesis enzyme MoeA-like protein
MRNVYIFAGMPSICKSMFYRVAADGRFDSEWRWVSCVLELDAVEEDILDEMHATVDAFPEVNIGSYPSTSLESDINGSGAISVRPPTWQCRLSIEFEAFSNEKLWLAWTHLKNAVPPHMLAEPPQAISSSQSSSPSRNVAATFL